MFSGLCMSVYVLRFVYECLCLEFVHECLCFEGCV